MNSAQIDNTDYYRLPCGRYLEDFIAWKRLDFAEGLALKYRWRAGKKDGETAEKDMAKMAHYARFIALRGCVDVEDVAQEVEAWLAEATAWNGQERPYTPPEG